MLSTTDLERLITEKRLEIESEKTALGLSPSQSDYSIVKGEQNEAAKKAKKQVRVAESSVPSKQHATKREDKKETSKDKSLYDLEENIPPGLERYIRRYIGLPVMLKAGEFSPNNPLIRAERNSDDVLLGLGEYERRRQTLRKIRQQQYREYLDEQARKKQEAKEKSERERREREEKERQREEAKERERQLEEERNSAEQRRASVCYVSSVSNASSKSQRMKVDTGVQVGLSRPLSVACQTDDGDLYRLSPSPTKSQITQAERELSPRTVVDPCDERPIQPAPWTKEGEEGGKWTGKGDGHTERRRRSYGEFERSSTVKRSNREKLVSDLRHSYMPSIYDADAIQRRNEQAEQEAAARRQFYQQELKNQIQEQQRIREERRSREKMLEQAEMRRLEEQLRMLRVAQERELGKQHETSAAMKENAMDFDKKRSGLQKEIELEQQKLFRARTQTKRNTATSHSDPNPSKLPFYCTKVWDTSNKETRPPYSTNIPDNSIFSPNYDVDTYLRRNLNPNKEILMSNRLENCENKRYVNIETIGDKEIDLKKKSEKNVIVEKAIIHECPKDKVSKEKGNYDTSYVRNIDELVHDNPIPVLRHSPNVSYYKDEDLSDAMKMVDDKWKVPAVQKNVLKTIPTEGKNVSILTQLGSIRRQLQLEQLKLDNMLPKDGG